MNFSLSVLQIIFGLEKAKFRQVESKHFTPCRNPTFLGGGSYLEEKESLRIEEDSLCQRQTIISIFSTPCTGVCMYVAT